MEYKKFYNYDVYENGAIYSHYRERFINPDIDGNGYKIATLYINSKGKKFKVHRLVAKLFLGDAPEGKPVVNHKDGNKLNNSVINLEWCSVFENNKHARLQGLNNVSDSNRRRYADPEYRKKQGLKLSKTLKETGIRKGENNGRFRYKIIDKSGKTYTREELAKILKRSQSNIDAWIKKSANGNYPKFFLNFGILIIDTKSKSQSTIESI